MHNLNRLQFLRLWTFNCLGHYWCYRFLALRFKTRLLIFAKFVSLSIACLGATFFNVILGLFCKQLIIAVLTTGGCVFCLRVNTERIKVDRLVAFGQLKVVWALWVPWTNCERCRVILLLVRLTQRRGGGYSRARGDDRDLLSAKTDLRARYNLEENAKVSKLILHLLFAASRKTEFIDFFLSRL